MEWLLAVVVSLPLVLMAWSSGQAVTAARLNGSNTSYTVAWTAVTADPGGTVSKTGSYTRSGRRVEFVISLTMQSGTTYGTGAWRFSLPSTADTTQPLIATAYLEDNGTALHIGTGKFVTSTTIEIFTENSVNSIGPSIPHTWADNDKVVIQGSYVE